MQKAGSEFRLDSQSFRSLPDAPKLRHQLLWVPGDQRPWFTSRTSPTEDQDCVIALVSASPNQQNSWHLPEMKKYGESRKYGREGGKVGGKERGQFALSASLAPIVSGCNNYQIRAISAIYCLFLIGSPRKTTRPTITGFLSILFTYELPKCFRKYLARGRLYIAHLLRITYPCCLSFETAVVILLPGHHCPAPS